MLNHDAASDEEPMRLDLSVVAKWMAASDSNLLWQCSGCGWQNKGWGGSLILSNAQKSAATPAHILPVSVVGHGARRQESRMAVPALQRKPPTTSTRFRWAGQHPWRQD